MCVCVLYICVCVLRDPLPAKHLEEQTDTKTYDLWCRKGGGTGWQDIKATDSWCRKGGGTGWQDIKARFVVQAGWRNRVAGHQGYRFVVQKGWRKRVARHQCY